MASRAQLRRATEDDGSIARHLCAVRDAMVWALRSNVDDRPMIDSGRALAEYLRLAQGCEQVEVVRILYLNVGQRLLAEEIAARGTVDEAPVFVREIVRRALDLGAAGLVVVHNHPSGDSTPSQSDIVLTRRLAEAAGLMGLRLHDHLVVSAASYVSFRAEGLI